MFNQRSSSSWTRCLRSAVLATGVISLAAACSVADHGSVAGGHPAVTPTAITATVPAGALPAAAGGTASPSPRTSGSATPSAGVKPARNGSGPGSPSSSTGSSGSASPPPVNYTGQCGGNAPNTPGGADPWGGCWPGPGNTGPVVALARYAGKVNSDGSCQIKGNTVITGKVLTCQIYVNSGNLTLENDQIQGEVYNNGSGSVLIEHTTINGGTDQTETVLGDHITIDSSNLYGNQHEVYCGGNCTITNSWLHDNYNFGPAVHQNGFLSTGGDTYSLQHNSVGCVGGCTGDISFLGDESQAVVNKNLLVASPDAAYCLYPSSTSGSVVVNQMTITDNVFQRGGNGKCATYGPVYGWDESNNNPGTSGYLNVWSGNIWDNGRPIQAP